MNCPLQTRRGDRSGRAQRSLAMTEGTGLASQTAKKSEHRATQLLMRNTVFLKEEGG